MLTLTLIHLTETANKPYSLGLQTHTHTHLHTHTHTHAH